VSVHNPSSLTLRAVAPCWVQITDTAGHTLFTATLQPGQHQQIPISGPLVVRLGNTPAIAISINGAGLDLGGLAQAANLAVQTA